MLLPDPARAAETCKSVHMASVPELPTGTSPFRGNSRPLAMAATDLHPSNSFDESVMGCFVAESAPGACQREGARSHLCASWFNGVVVHAVQEMILVSEDKLTHRGIAMLKERVRS